MKKTALARFECATRMRRHQTYSLWTISIFSAGLIIFPIVKAFGIPIHVSAGAFDVMQVGLALMVLVLSLLVSANNVGDKAEKMHRCGLEVNALCHEVLPFCRTDTDDKEKYESFRLRYAQILAVYENHDPIDFEQVKLLLPTEYNLTGPQRFFIRLRYWLNFWVYAALMVVLLACLRFAFFG
jgi:hypothetical protein